MSLDESRLFLSFYREKNLAPFSLSGTSRGVFPRGLHFLHTEIASSDIQMVWSSRNGVNMMRINTLLYRGVRVSTWVAMCSDEVDVERWQIRIS